MNKMENATEVLYHEQTTLPPSKPLGVTVVETSVISYVAVLGTRVSRGHVIEQRRRKLLDEDPLEERRQLVGAAVTNAVAIRLGIRAHDAWVAEIQPEAVR